MVTKEKMIYEYLRQGNALTQDTAKGLFGASRLSAVIFRIKAKRGKHYPADFDIQAPTIPVRDQFGNECYVSQYRMTFGGQCVLPF